MYLYRIFSSFTFLNHFDDDVLLECGYNEIGTIGLYAVFYFLCDAHKQSTPTCLRSVTVQMSLFIFVDYFSKYCPNNKLTIRSLFEFEKWSLYNLMK